MKKYLSDSKMFEFDAYYKECQTYNQPFIKARKNYVDGNYLVILDLNTCNYFLPEVSRNNVKTLFSKEILYLQSLHPKKIIFKGCNIDKELTWFDGVVSERLNDFCNNLFDLSNNGIQ